MGKDRPRRPAFLVTHGSFNPVHRQHVEMMVAARAALEEAGFSVQRGIMGITPQWHVQRKGAEAVTDSHRLAALQLACDAICGAEQTGPPGWLMPDARGVEYGSGHQFAKALTPELVALAPGAAVFKVIGADTAVRYPTEMCKLPTVVVCRQGSTEALHRVIKERGLARRDLLLTDELPGEECSSTKLRRAINSLDVPAVQGCCIDVVADYLLAHQQDLYATKPVVRGSAGDRGDPASGGQRSSEATTSERRSGRWGQPRGES